MGVNLDGPFFLYQAAIGSYRHRAWGVLTGSVHVFLLARRACIVMLKKDGRWRNPRSRLRLWRRTWAFWLAVVPGAIRSALPGHDPRREDDPQWVLDWIAGYAAAPPEYVPMLDTSHPDIPVPFPQAAA